MPRVSAIINTRNRSLFLPTAIESVFAQTFRDVECIVVDDASEDDTPALLTSYSGRFDLKVLRVESSRGANHARNQGIACSRGELLAFLDDDDVWHPEKLESQVAVFDADPGVALVGCGCRIWDRPRCPPPEVSYRDLLKDNLLGGFSMCMFRRRDVEALGGLDESLQNAQDWDLWLALSRRGRVRCVQKCLVDYATHEMPRITTRVDRTGHYRNYLKVVQRHEKEMTFWTRQYHYTLVNYHLTSPRHIVSRALRGACHGFFYLIGRRYLSH